jgi:hypothetical protein
MEQNQAYVGFLLRCSPSSQDKPTPLDKALKQATSTA